MSIGAQGEATQMAEDPFDFSAEAAAEGGAEKRARPGEEWGGGTRARGLRMRRRTQADRTYARLRERGETTTRAGETEEGDGEEEVNEAAGSEWEEAISEPGASAAGGEAEGESDGEGTGCSWDAALRGVEVLEWVKGVCRGGAWADRGDEAEVADLYAEIRQRHGEVTMAELRKALGEAEEADMVLVRGATVHFI